MVREKKGIVTSVVYLSTHHIQSKEVVDQLQFENELKQATITCNLTFPRI